VHRVANKLDVDTCEVSCAEARAIQMHACVQGKSVPVYVNLHGNGLRWTVDLNTWEVRVQHVCGHAFMLPAGLCRGQGHGQSVVCGVCVSNGASPWCWGGGMNGHGVKGLQADVVGCGVVLQVGHGSACAFFTSRRQCLPGRGRGRDARHLGPGSSGVSPRTNVWSYPTSLVCV